MIIDSPAIVDLALGADRRIMQQGDAQLQFPAILTTQIGLMKPTRTVKDPAAVQNESGFVHLTQSRTNQVALTTAIMILSKGMWRIQISMVTKFNWSAAAGTIAGVKLEMSYIGDTNSLLMHLADGLSDSDYTVYDFLLIDQATLQLTTDLTGVGQTSDARATVNAVRIL